MKNDGPTFFTIRGQTQHATRPRPSVAVGLSWRGCKGELEQRIEAPQLLLIAEHGMVNQRFGNDPPELDRRIACFKNLQTVAIPDSGHNVQHDQPELAAEAIERFLLRD